MDVPCLVDSDDDDVDDEKDDGKIIGHGFFPFAHADGKRRPLEPCIFIMEPGATVAFHRLGDMPDDAQQYYCARFPALKAHAMMHYIHTAHAYYLESQVAFVHARVRSAMLRANGASVPDRLKDRYIKQLEDEVAALKLAERQQLREQALTRLMVQIQHIRLLLRDLVPVFEGLSYCGDRLIRRAYMSSRASATALLEIVEHAERDVLLLDARD